MTSAALEFMDRARRDTKSVLRPATMHGHVELRAAGRDTPWLVFVEHRTRA